MRQRPVIRIKKSPQPQRLLGLLMVLPFLLGTLTELLYLPDGIRYVLDGAWLWLLVWMLRFSKKLGRTSAWRQARWVTAFAVYTLAAYLPRWQSGLYYLWGFRNNFRFYIAFFAFTACLTEEDGEGYFRKLDKLFWFNAVVSLAQYFLLGKSGDYLGGLFGCEQGCNAYTNLFFVLVVTRSLVLFLDNREGWGSCIAKCGTALLVAALAELKFFFIEFGLIALLAVCLSGFTWRKVWVILGAVVGMVAGAVLLAALFPEFASWFSVEWLLDAAGSDRGYTSSGDLNRLNCITMINQWFFHSPGLRLFGLGMGNCDTSAYDFLNTPFFQLFSSIHYTWMSTSFWYLEGGYVGLIFFFGFFVSVYLAAGRLERRREGLGKVHCRVARILAVVCCAIAVYNASLRTEAAYMAYFVLALPFMRQSRKGG